MMTSMMANMDPAMIKSMTKMASRMGGGSMAGMGGMGGMPAMGNGTGAGPSALAGGMPGMEAMAAGGRPSLGAGVDMMANMSPEMMQAGLDVSASRSKYSCICM